MTRFRVRSPKFFGPIDLLVDLVRAQELRILDVGLADIAAAFLDHLTQLGVQALEEAGEFIVPLATLLELKSRELIPRATIEEEPAEADAARTTLVRQLLEYRRFKEAAALLSEKAAERQKKFGRGIDEFAALDPAERPIREIELWDLVSAFGRLMRENVVPVADEIAKDPTPLPVYMDRMAAIVVAAGTRGANMAALFGLQNTKVQLIGKFLALLELIKTNRIWVELAENGEDLVFAPPRTEAKEPVDPSGLMADETAPPGFATLSSATDSTNKVVDERSTRHDSIVEGEAPSNSKGKSSAWQGFEPLVE